MRDVSVVMKTGGRLSGPMWTWRPKEGWFELAGVEGRIALDDVQSATGEAMVVFNLVQRIDYLQRALDEGWVPKEPK